MSNKTKMIAAAQVVVTAGSGGGPRITFNANNGFKESQCVWVSVGVYDLVLSHSHNINKLCFGATRSAVGGSIQVLPIEGGSGNDTNLLRITNFDANGLPADSTFFVMGWRIRS